MQDRPSSAARRLHAAPPSRLPFARLFLLLCCAVLIGAASRPAKATLFISGNPRHAALWRKIYDRLPAFWKSHREIVVQEVSDPEMERLVARTDGKGDEDHAQGDSGVDGCYQNSGTEDAIVITLRARLKGEEAGLVFAHEYGHFVWDEILTEEERAQYVALWRSQKRARRLVTRYAQTSEEEGFAEAFGHLIVRPAVLKRRDPRSWQFLQDLPEPELPTSD